MSRRRRSAVTCMTGWTVAAASLLLATLTGCIGGGTAEETSPAPVKSTPVTRPVTPQDVVDDVLLPQSKFPAGYQAMKRIDRSLETGTNTLCGYDETEEKRVARVQVYYWTETSHAGASNEVVAYTDAATANGALRFNQRYTKSCDQAAQERNGIDNLRRATCPKGTLVDAVCVRYDRIDDTGQTTSHTYKIVQVRGDVFTSTYADAPEIATAVRVTEDLARKSAERIRKTVKP